MSIRPPTEEEVRQLGNQLYLDLTDTEVSDYRQLVENSLSAYETVRKYGQPANADDGLRSRDSGYRVRENDAYNGWITKCRVEGANSGPLAGWDVALKDNISLAGVEMTCGSAVIEGYIPKTDATIVTRLLDAGANIVGKANMDDMALSGAGFSSAFGPTFNPRKEGHLSGGSSGGSAIVVATGEVDLAIGCDQGGSIRIPASWSGVVGHKPTYGLVPYTGIIGLENTIDHVGPMARDVETVARALTVIAGKDPKDPRQPESVPTGDFASSLNGEVDGLRVGVIEEGFDQPGAEDMVNENVETALERLEDEGATLESVSIPMHHDVQDIHSVSLAEGLLAAFRGEGLGHNWLGWYDTTWVEAFGRARRARGGDFPVSVKLNLLLGAYMNDKYHSKFYAEAMNLREEFTKMYEESFKGFDLLALPTTPMRAREFNQEHTIDRFEFVENAWINLSNTMPFNTTGHPALNVPVEPAEGLPVGLQLVGPRFDDSTVLKAGQLIENDLEQVPN